MSAMKSRACAEKRRSLMMASSAATRSGAAAFNVVKPIFSRDLSEARRRARELYRAWYREVPNTGTTHTHTETENRVKVTHTHTNTIKPLTVKQSLFLIKPLCPNELK